MPPEQLPGRLIFRTGTFARTLGPGLLLAGMLLGALGSLAVVWRYELDRDPRAIGFHFFVFDAALFAAACLRHEVLRRISPRAVSVVSSVVASLAFLGLAFVAPPAVMAWRLGGAALLGAAAAGLLTSVLSQIRPYYELDAARTITVAGTMFGAGSVIVTLVIAGAYRLYRVGWEVAILAAVPLVLIAFVRGTSQPAPVRERSAPRRARRSELRSITAVLFSLLLFFQFGNEWALAGWLPFFLIRRLGISPEGAISVLALYFFSLLAGRLAAQTLRRYISSARLLWGSVVFSMFGYLTLSLTDTGAGAAFATAVTGLGYAPMYGLVAEKIGHRFDFEPRFFSSIFSFAVTGGMLIPCFVGFAGYYVGMQYLLLVPTFGSLAVLLLMLLVMLESRLMRDEEPSSAAAKAPKTMAAAAGKK